MLFHASIARDEIHRRPRPKGLYDDASLPRQRTPWCLWEQILVMTDRNHLLGAESYLRMPRENYWEGSGEAVKLGHEQLYQHLQNDLIETLGIMKSLEDPRFKGKSMPYIPLSSIDDISIAESG